MLKIEHLSHRFGPRTTLEDLDFFIPSGTVFGLLGPNGAGKTTFLRFLTGEIDPTLGKIFWNERPISSLGDAWKRKLGWAPETPELFPYLGFRDNLLATAALWGFHKNDAGQRADSLLDFFELTWAAELLASEGSLGMRKKLSLMHALITDPEVLLLDEPFNGLDAKGCKQVRTLMRILTEGGKTLVLTSHILDGLEPVLGGLGILDAGRLVFFQPEGWRPPQEGLEAFYFSHFQWDSPSKGDLSWLI